MKSVAIEKIELRIGNKTIPLSLDEARELKSALEQLFPTPSGACYPIVIRDRYPYWPKWDGPYWCSNQKGSTLQLNATSGTN